MLVKVCYWGFYPLGSDVKINNIEIMKSKWHVYKKPLITYGKKNAVNPFLQDLFYVVSKEDVVFFVAIESGLGHYHIFTVNERRGKKLSKHIRAEDSTYNPIAVHINKVGHAVRVYGRVVSGARDMNFKVDDSFFKLIGTTSYEDYTRYVFTNNDEDRFYLDVYNPSMVDNSELFILIGRADKIIWRWSSTEIGECFQEYKLLETYVEMTRKDADGKVTLYYH